jgi:phosphorylcholine metabolism protein LicD
MNKSGFLLRLYLVSTYLKLRYPLYINLPPKHIYAFHILINFLKILKFQKIDFFLLAGSLLGAVRQESFAGRPTDVDLGIREDQLPKLFNSIP